MTRFAIRAMLVALVASVFVPSQPVYSQVFQGRIDVTVVDTTGAVLPGANVDLSGPTTRSAVTDGNGEVHFLNLAPGTYVVAVKLGNFGDYRNEQVVVAAGASTNLRAEMRVAERQEAIQVLAESPVIDAKKQAIATTVSLEELQNIPTARDPWVVMQTVPSIIVDRVNVGGSESGQQSNFLAKGAAGEQNAWNLDGIPVTDMAATGATPTYFDFDMFQEMNITTGGADVSVATPGVQLNFVLKSGTNVPHGSTRIFYEDEGMQSNNVPESLKDLVGGVGGKGNRTEDYKDYGVEAGGPIVKDRLWVWGSYGKTDVTIRTLTDVPDQTILENYAFKANATVGENMHPSFTYFRGNKEKFGRGASATRPDETTWNQSGPTDMYKGEVNFTVGSNLFLTGRYAHMKSGFTLEPRGGRTSQRYIDTDGVEHNTYYFYESDRPQDTIVGEGNWFKGRHELKFGYSWRRTPVDSVSGLPNGIYSEHCTVDSCGEDYADTGRMISYLYRDYNLSYTARYMSGWIGDTITFDRMTLTGALRWNRSTGSNDPVSVSGISEFDDILPGATDPGAENAIKWNTVSPKVGVNYALNKNNTSIARASYAMFAGQLGAADSTQISAIQYSSIYYYAIDSNRDNITQRNEILFDLGPIGYYGFDINNPGASTSVNNIGADLSAPRTHEVIVGLDHQLARNFGLSASLTWRQYNNLTWDPLIGIRRPDYVQVSTLTGSVDPVGSFSVPVFAPRDLNALPVGYGTELVNREGYHQRYIGLELSATKRLADRWMARVGFSTNNHTEYFDNPDTSQMDPTPRRVETTAPGTPSANVNGGMFVTQTAGSGKSDIFLTLPKYQFIATGFYEGPWQINFGANYVMRQGYVGPFHNRITVAEDPTNARKRVLLVPEVDTFRLPNVHSLDIRIEKAFRIRDRANLIVDLDVFNVGNLSTILGREYNRAVSTFDQVREIMQPRILRIGGRFTF
jgi:hypothetical protein